MDRLRSTIAALALVVLALGLPLLALQAPAFTGALSDRYSLGDAAGLDAATTRAVAGQVWAFVVLGEGDLPTEVAGRPGFDEGAVSHLRDVASVIRSARTLTLALAFGVAAWAVWALRSGRLSEVARALVWAAVAIGAGVAVALAVALVDFDAFFAAFHRAFFAEGTWTFPYDSLLIRLFPEPFWTAAGLSWAGGIALLVAVYLATGLALGRRARVLVRGSRTNSA